MIREAFLAELLSFTRDGEWGKGEPTDGYSAALVIRGTDFERVRWGVLSTLPVRYIRSDVLARKAVVAGDTLIETAGGTKDQPTGRTVFIKQELTDRAPLPLVCASFARLLRPDPHKIDPAFLFWKLQDEYKARRMMPYHIQHTGVARFQYTQFAQKFPLSLPPQSEQHAIGATLSTLDDKIELNRQMNETLEEMASAIFRDWFVDFGPTRTKMERRAPYLAPDIWRLFPDTINNTIGLPDGWRSEPLGSHMINFDAKRVPVSGGERAKRQGVYPYHGATGVMGCIDDYLFDGTFLLVGEDGSVVNDEGLAFTQYVWGRFWVNNHAHVLQGKGAVSTEQLLMHFRHAAVTPYITGAVQLKLSQGRMNSMPFVFGGDEICQAFSETVDPLFKRLKANSDENAALTETRDYLLPKLMSGEVRAGAIA